jgi:hypothetical protein
VHDAVVVIPNAHRIDLFLDPEIGLGTGIHVFGEDPDVLVTIWTTLLVPEPNDVANLV